MWELLFGAAGLIIGVTTTIIGVTRWTGRLVDDKVGAVRMETKDETQRIWDSITMHHENADMHASTRGLVTNSECAKTVSRIEQTQQQGLQSMKDLMEMSQTMLKEALADVKATVAKILEK